MSLWKSSKAKQVLAALIRIDWIIKRHKGSSHRIFARKGWAAFAFAFALLFMMARKLALVC